MNKSIIDHSAGLPQRVSDDSRPTLHDGARMALIRADLLEVQQ